MADVQPSCQKMSHKRRVKKQGLSVAFLVFSFLLNHLASFSFSRGTTMEWRQESGSAPSVASKGNE